MDAASTSQLKSSSTTTNAQFYSTPEPKEKSFRVHFTSVENTMEAVTPSKTIHTSHPSNLHVLLFGDQTAASDLQAHIKDLYQQASRSHSLQAFLRNTTDALQSSIVKLDPTERKHFPICFQSILDLAFEFQQQRVRDVVLSTILFCVAQLGSLIIEADNDPFLLIPSETRRCILGVCSGFIPAAAASASQSARQLIDIGPEIVCISLHTGLEAYRRSQRIEPGSGNWAYVVVGLSALELQAIIEDFHQCNLLPPYMNLYISAYFEGSLTVSGPPAILRSLATFSQTFANASKQLPIAAAFHAPHLQRPDYGKIIGSSTVLDLPLTGNVEIISASASASHELKHAKNLGELLIVGLEDIFQTPLDWSRTIQSIIMPNLLAERGPKAKIFLTSFGPNALVKSFLKVAAIEGVEVILTKPRSTGTLPTETDSKFRSGSGDVAIVGMSGRFPGANDLQEFWEILRNGRDLHKEIPRDRFDIKTHYDPSGTTPNTTTTPFGCFIEKPGLFDSRLFRMSPREARQTDPIQRLLLLSTYEALEMAGYARDECGPLSIPSSMRGERFATFFGQTTDDWRECNAGQDIDNFYIPGGMRAFGPGRLNYWFKWEGASYSIDTACSSSSAAVEMACASLLARKCDTAVAGGGNILSGPNMFAGLSRGGFLSPTGNCKTFSDEADGYCRGDAVGVVVLKRLEDAIADKDNIQGLIKSISTNHSAHAVSITHPHAPTQQKLYNKVLHDASIEPSSLRYIEMHGTGTKAGDAAEMASVTAVFGKDRLPSNPLYVGSAKANVGHSEAGAGIVSLIKSLLMFRKGEIPPHPMKGALNRKFSLQDKNVFIASAPLPFEGDADEPNRILLNNFNATGGNTVMLLEEAPNRLTDGEDPRSHHVVTVSASTPLSLTGNKRKMLEFIQSNPSVDVRNLSYTTTARRMHHGFRNAFSVSSTAELIELLTKDLQAASAPNKPNGRPSIAFVFTGQGSHFPGMGEHLYSTSSSFRESIMEFESVCVELGFPVFTELITTSSFDFSLASTVEIQLATVSLELALARLYTSWGVHPDLVIGHSVGEYAAMHMAGVLSLADMFYLVGKRAELVLDKCSVNTHSMLAIKATLGSVQETLQEARFASCCISCVNSLTSVVVSGPVDAIQQLKIHLVDVGASSTIINLPYAFHSHHIDPILIPFRKFAEQVRFAEPSIPIASSLLGDVIKNRGVFSADYLVRHAIEKVNFVGALQECESTGLTDEKTIWIENGPGSSSVSMIRATIPTGLAFSTLKPTEPTWKTISKVLAAIYSRGGSLDWPEYHKQYKNSLRLLELPTYAFDLKDYWIQYEGNWALTKNRQAAIAPDTRAFSTTTLHRIENELFSEKQATVTFVSDLEEQKLLSAIRGHLVNGCALCPSSVYADMAFTAARYLHSKQNSSQVPSMDLTLMEVFHPLVIAENNENHQIVVSASKSIDSDSVHVTFSSRKGSSDAQEHGHCTVVFGDGQGWMDNWSRNSYLISERRDSLFNLATSHPTHRILGSLVYKLFGTLVDYSIEYRCLTEVFMNEVLNEAAAKLRFNRSPVGTIFTYSPYWIDSIVHLAGFVLNGHIITAQDDVYISHGWESLKIAAPLHDNHEYTSYVRMQPVGNKGVFIGDVSIFDGDQTVATCSGLKFQKMKKNVLQTLLDATSKPKTPISSVEGALSCWPSIEVMSKPEYWNPDRITMQSPQKAEPAPLITPIALANTDASVLTVLKVIAEEIGVGTEDLSDNTRFDDLGVDSLLTISITTNLRNHTNFDLPTSVFASCPTVAQLRKYLETKMRELHNSQRNTGEASSYCSESESPTEGTVSPATSVHSSDGFDVIDAFISAIAEETGLESHDLKDADNFEDLGIDSIMSIAILGSIRNRMGADLPTSIFRTYPTLGQFKEAFGKPVKPAIPSEVSLDTKSWKTELSSNSVFLQGKPNAGLPTLFLIADGAGSASSYINIPEFFPKLPVYALESPFLHRPTEFNCSIEEVSEIFVAKIRSIQSHGPYFIGGWSLGGIYAYEIARQLISNFHEEVRGILMIDSPCPRPIDMPEPTMELMQETGLFIGIKRAGKAETPMPLSQKQHLLSCVKALRVYNPIPIPYEKRPRNVFMIWAKNGLFEKLGAKIKEVAEDESVKSRGGDGEGLKKDWLTAERTSFGPNGWDRLLGSDIECHAIEGDHFSIMNLPRINDTGELMQRALHKFLAD